MTFSQAPYWASGSSRAGLPHAISVLVTPAIAIVASTIANPTVLTTAAPHNLVSGDTVAVLGHIGSTPAIDGSRVATVIDATHLSVPVNVTIAGAGGTVTRTIAADPLTLVQGKLRAGLDWTDGDARDVLMRGFIAAARAKVEKDTAHALLLQTRDVYFDEVSGRVLTLPALSKPLQAVVAVSSIDSAGAVQVLNPSNYDVDLVSGRLGLSLAGAWPTDLRPFQPYVLRIVSGWPSVAALEAEAPDLVHAVGLLTAHYATVGRDLATVGTIIAETPFGYEDAISSYRPVVVA